MPKNKFRVEMIRKENARRKAHPADFRERQSAKIAMKAATRAANTKAAKAAKEAKDAEAARITIAAASRRANQDENINLGNQPRT